MPMLLARFVNARAIVALVMLGALALAGCPGLQDRTLAGGNDFEGPVRLDDDLVASVDPAMLPVVGPIAACNPPVLGVVTSVTDGDTIRVTPIEGTLPEDRPIRLIGVDTPEVAHPEGMPPTTAECYGNTAGIFTEQLLDRVVWLTFDAGCTDSNGRYLAYVWVGPGIEDLWQRQLLRRGLATTLSIEPNTAYAGVFNEDELFAQGVDTGIELGLWAACR